MAGSSSGEVILAEEEAVMNRGVGIIQEVKSDLDIGKVTEGNLVLTNLRLLYAHGREKEVDIPVGTPDPFETLGKKRLFISDVDDLDDIPYDPANITIEISSITSVKGHHTRGLAPKLEVRWNEGGYSKVTEFVEQETGRSRRKNLDDWAAVIERLKTHTQSITALPPAPDQDSLEWRILLNLDDMQERGLLTIASEVEKKYGLDLDPDTVRQSCENLASQGFIKRTTSSEEGPFYVKVSPLGDDDLNQ